MSKPVPTPVPGATKEPFFAHQWLLLTPGPLPLEGMSGFPRWHTETAIRGRKPGGRGHHGRAARAEEEGGQRGHEAAVCVLNSLKDAFILWHAQVMQARVRQALETNNYFRVEFEVELSCRSANANIYSNRSVMFLCTVEEKTFLLQECHQQQAYRLARSRA